MRIVLLGLLLLNLTACASYLKRKSCESINWFEHGKQVALRGEWLNSDKTLNECRKVDADIQESQLDLGFKNGMQKYCTGPNAYWTGKNGDFFSRDLCEGPQIQTLLQEHKKGVRDYCDKTNGQTAGSSGKKYQNICPKELEVAFLPEYRKGRKKYVQAMITNRESDLRDLDIRLQTKRMQLSFDRGRLDSLQSEFSSLETQRNLTPLENSSERGYYESRMSSLSSDISSLRSRVYSQESEVNSLEEDRRKKLQEMSDFKSELPGLD